MCVFEREGVQSSVRRITIDFSTTRHKRSGFRSTRSEPAITTSSLGYQPCVVRCPSTLDASLVDSNKVHGPTAQNMRRNTLFRRFPLYQAEFWCGTDGIGNIIFQAFHPYKECPRRSPYAIWASESLCIAPGIRGGLELELDWTSNLVWTCGLSPPHPSLFSSPPCSSPLFLNTIKILGTYYY
jgi:hypothetical protein